MSKKVNPTAVGLFIVVGVALGVIGLIIFSSGRLFSKREKFILYFDASLKGLNVGAPVKMRGVTIGSVVQLLIRHNQASNDYYVPVIIEIDQKLLQSKTDQRVNPAGPVEVMQIVRQGLRGKLDAESLVTGVLYVELQFIPNAGPPEFHQLTPEYPEIPTVSTAIQELLANLAHLDLRGISEKLNSVLAALDLRLNELDVKQINYGVTNLLASADRVLTSPDLSNSLANLDHLLADMRTLVQRVDGRVDPLADGVTNVLDQAQHTLTNLRAGVENLAGMIQPNAPFRTDLSMALDQISDAARAITELAEFLERNPNALLTGRKRLPTP